MMTVSLKSITDANIKKAFLKNEKSPRHLCLQISTVDSCPSDEQWCSDIYITQASNMVEKIEDVFLDNDTPGIQCHNAHPIQSLPVRMSSDHCARQMNLM